MPVTVTEIDHGYKRFVTDITAMGHYTVKVGIMSGESVEGVAVVDYALWNEFGTSRIPARPFISTTYDLHHEEVEKFIEFLANKLIVGGTTPDAVANTLGQQYVKKIQETIRHAGSWAVPNAPSTVEQKGSSSPLIDTGRMLNAVSYEVIK